MVNILAVRLPPHCRRADLMAIVLSLSLELTRGDKCSSCWDLPQLGAAEEEGPPSKVNSWRGFSGWGAAADNQHSRGPVRGAAGGPPREAGTVDGPF